MDYINIDDKILNSLESSLSKEILEANQSGTYLYTTINGCNTRKYHGLFVTEIDEFAGDKHVLLSTLHASIDYKDRAYNLDMHRFAGGFYNNNNLDYLVDFELLSYPKLTYKIDDITVTKELLLDNVENILLIKYSFKNVNEPLTLRLKPFLAFRNIHTLSHNNDYVRRKYDEIDNGIKLSLYDGYPHLSMQLDGKMEYIAAPDWYYNVEYVREIERGFEAQEDLYIPGFFEIKVEDDQSLIFSASTKELEANSLADRFTKSADKKTPSTDFLNTLKSTSRTFIINKHYGTDVIAGFPWYRSISRQALIALPGISLLLDDAELFKNVLDTYKSFLNNGSLPDSIDAINLTYNNADVSLWFIWAVQEYLKIVLKPNQIWESFGKELMEIVESYRNGQSEFAKMDKSGLIYAFKEKTALTWMDTTLHGSPTFQRGGYNVEINALWYNAICFVIDLAKSNKEKEFTKTWRPIRDKVKSSFNTYFVDDKHDHIADTFNNNMRDWAIRPNMVIATSFDYSPLKVEKRKLVLKTAKDKLLTRKGLRTLSSDHLRYKGHLYGNHFERESALLYGATYPWLFRFFAEGYLKVYKHSGVTFIKQLLLYFEEELNNDCLRTVSEYNDGDKPHESRGAVSQAWNLGGVAFIAHLTMTMEKKK